MIEVGPAAQTLAAVRRLADGRTGQMFASVNAVAVVACLSRRTVMRHLDQLVEGGWLTYRGREKRRTATYIVPRRVLRNDQEGEKFALLPRWAAMLLPTWGERCVFALIVSNDALCEWIDEQNGGNHSDNPEEQGYAAAVERRMFSVAAMVEASGLNPETICEAKRKLAKRKIIKIDPAVWYRDDFGRCKTMADSLFLNPDFRVPCKFIDDPQSRQSTKSHRVRKLAHTHTDSGTPPYTDSGTQVYGNCHIPIRKLTQGYSETGTRSEENSEENYELNSEENLLNIIPDKISGTAAGLGGGGFSEREDQNAEPTDDDIDHSKIDYAERHRQLQKQFKALGA
jgi:hypothetical protein